MVAAYGFHVILTFVIGYLLGSLPFGVILSKLKGAVDPRSIGSGNIGATNVLRTGDKALAAMVLVCDMLKGTLAVLIGWLIGGEGTALAAGVGAFLGHLFPVWLGFRGGKGVATFIGVLIGLAPLAAAAFAAVWLGLAYATRYSSLAALTASVAAPLVLWLALGQSRMAATMAVLTVLLWIMHRENVVRLLAGREDKIGAKG